MSGGTGDESESQSGGTGGLGSTQTSFDAQSDVSSLEITGAAPEFEIDPLFQNADALGVDGGGLSDTLAGRGQNTNPIEPFSGRVATNGIFDAAMGQGRDAFTNTALFLTANQVDSSVSAYSGGFAASSVSVTDKDLATIQPSYDIFDIPDLSNEDNRWWGTFLPSLLKDIAADRQDALENSQWVDDGKLILRQNFGKPLPSPQSAPNSPLPPLPPPEQSLPPLPPPNPVGAFGEPQSTSEITITASVPFSPETSNSAALKAAEGMGHIEWGDVVQLGKGAYNGLAKLKDFADLFAFIETPALAPLIHDIDLPKFDIDPRYGGAAIVGEQLGQNLAFEAAGAASALRGMTTLGPRSVDASALAIERLGQDFITSERAWARYQIWATGTPFEDVFRIIENGTTKIFKADSGATEFLVEAKEGYMGFFRNRFWEKGILKQARSYLQVADQFSYRGVRYALSDADKVEGLLALFEREFPEAIESGKLSVWWVPKP